eukprot:6184757-Pleurochrysis_carterae.AAC.1
MRKLQRRWWRRRQQRGQQWLRGRNRVQPPRVTRRVRRMRRRRVRREVGALGRRQQRRCGLPTAKAIAPPSAATATLETSKPLSAVPRLAKQVGLDNRRVTPPSTLFAGDQANPFAFKHWADRVKKHVSTVLRGRCDTVDHARL